MDDEKSPRMKQMRHYDCAFSRQYCALFTPGFSGWGGSRHWFALPHLLNMAINAYISVFASGFGFKTSVFAFSYWAMRRCVTKKGYLAWTRRCLNLNLNFNLVNSLILQYSPLHNFFNENPKVGAGHMFYILIFDLGGQISGQMSWPGKLLRDASYRLRPFW